MSSWYPTNTFRMTRWEPAHSALNKTDPGVYSGILLFITLFGSNFFLAFPCCIDLRTFVALTLVKAYFIVGYFMHLKFDHCREIQLAASFLLLIVYLIFIALYELPHACAVLIFSVNMKLALQEDINSLAILLFRSSSGWYWHEETIILEEISL